ncbi:MAG: hypothetical protein JXA93_07520 [Anaerolineae bacterium]|nr:hypothetical protein [Anaerolineae bacterium]
MGNVAWRAGVTIVLLVAVAVAGPRTGQSGHTRDAAQAQSARDLPMGAGDASISPLPGCPSPRELVPDVAPCWLDVEWLDGSPLTRQSGAAMGEMARISPWVEGDDTPIPH